VEHVLTFLIFFGTSVVVRTFADAYRDFEGLVLLRRYARTSRSQEARDACRAHVLADYPNNLPTTKSPGAQVDFLLATNGSALVFDFEKPDRGLGNCKFLVSEHDGRDPSTRHLTS